MIKKNRRQIANESQRKHADILGKTWLRGYIHWFDNLTGEGVVNVVDLEGRSVFVHWSASQELDKVKNKSLEYRKKIGGPFIEFNSLDIVEVKVIQDSHFEQVCKIKKSKWIKVEDLLSDKLLEYLDSTNDETSSDWDNFILNNILGFIDAQNTKEVRGT